MPNIIGLNTKLYGSNKNIKPAAEPAEEPAEEEQAAPQRVLNVILSESWMNKKMSEGE